MHGRQFLFLDLEECNPEIECLLRRIRDTKRKSKKKLAEEPTPPSNLSILLLALMIHPQDPICPVLWGHPRLNLP